MGKSFFRFIWRYSRFDQYLIVLIVLASLPFYFVLLDLPKLIVNGAIQGRGFEASETVTFLRLTVPWGENPTVLFDGFRLRQLPLLLATSFAFLALVIVNGLFKFAINTAKGRLGERMLRRLRFMLFDRLHTFPIARFREIKSTEVATMIKDETEPLGGFIGDAVVQPVFLGGMAFTALFFIVVQDVWLGLVAGAVALCQVLIVPRMRAPILELGRQRQLMARGLAGRIGQSVDTMQEVRNHGTGAYERGAIAKRLGHIFDVRFRIYQRKFHVKFVNNLLAQITPFLFYVMGGYFVIRGTLDIGQLLAVLVAYKELPGPMKELIDWDQRRLDAQIKYEQIVEQFSGSDEASKGETTSAAPEIRVSALTVRGQTDAPVLGEVDGVLPLDLVASVEGEGASVLLHCIGGLRDPDGGRITIGGHETGSAGAVDVVASVLDQVPLTGETVFDNMVYPLLRQVPDDDVTSQWGREAKRSGNPAFPANANWTELGRAGAAAMPALRAAMVDHLRTVGMEDDLYAWGLRQPLGTAVDPALVVQARTVFAHRSLEEGLDRYIEGFDAGRYIENATIGENLLFGISQGVAFQGNAFAIAPILRRALREVEADMVSIGREIAAFMVEVFDDVSAENSPLLRFASFDGSRIPEFAAILATPDMDEDDRTKLIELALTYDESRYRLGLVTVPLRERIVAARARFMALAESEASGAVAFYDPDHAATGAPMIDSILFGKVKDAVAGARQRIERELRSVLTEKGLLGVVLDAGLEFATGHRAALLSTAQRQRIAVARCLLRRPQMLLLDNALSAMRMEEERMIVERIANSGIGLLMVTDREAVSGIPETRLRIDSGGMSVHPNIDTNER